MSQAEETNTTTGPPCPEEHASSVNAFPPQPVVIMASLLRTMGTDLRNERDVIRALIGAKFTSRQVKNEMDHAIALAR